MKIKSLYITAVFNLKITEDLGKGMHVRGEIYLTNNVKFIQSLLTKDLLQAIGNLEFDALFNADAVFYKISDDIIYPSNEDNLLCDFLANCKIIINELWLIRDHSIDIMLGFVEYPFQKLSGIELPFHNVTVHSNWVTGGSFTSTGEHQITIFSRQDVDQIISFGTTLLVEPFSQSQGRKTAIRPGIQRISRCTVFLQTARLQADLGIKIIHYCSAFECLFSTDAKELTHKLAERISYFLEAEPRNRIELYNDLKNIYSIRSQVTHGSSISKKHYHRLTDFSEKADNILRRVLIKLQEKEYLDQYYRRDNNEELEIFLTELTLGYDKFETAD